MANWTVEQLKNLRGLSADVMGTLGEGRIHIIPVSRGRRQEGYGSRITWEARLYRKGVMGPSPVTQGHLESLGLTTEEANRWANQTLKATSTLNKLYPALVQEIETKVREIQESLPAALPWKEEEISLQ